MGATRASILGPSAGTYSTNRTKNRFASKLDWSDEIVSFIYLTDWNIFVLIFDLEGIILSYFPQLQCTGKCSLHHSLGLNRKQTRKGCFFDKFVVAEFACKPALSLEERMCMVCERFELILSHAFDASSLGRTIKHLDRGERIGFVQEALGGKAYATLKARASTAARLIAWAQEPDRSAFPIDSTILTAFTEHVVRSGGKYSAMSAVLETVRFLHFVLGVDCDLQALKHPLVQGRLRKCRLERKPRRQARPFSVEEVAALERFVKDCSKSAIDRYAAGYMLFAVMGRARLGDLKSVKSFICDFDPMAVVSLSHKTRSFGNALGLELPIVAPAVPGPLSLGLFVPGAKFSSGSKNKSKLA